MQPAGGLGELGLALESDDAGGELAQHDRHAAVARPKLAGGGKGAAHVGALQQGAEVGVLQVGAQGEGGQVGVDHQLARPGPVGSRGGHGVYLRFG